MKNRCSRADRNDILFLVAFLGQLHEIQDRMKDRLITEEEHHSLEISEEAVTVVLTSVITRMEKNQKGFASQIKRDSDKVEIEMFLPGVHYIENKGAKLVISRPLVKELVEGCAVRCLGCTLDQDSCELRRLKDILDETPLNPNSDICPYRIAGDEIEDFEIGGDTQ